MLTPTHTHTSPLPVPLLATISLISVTLVLVQRWSSLLRKHSRTSRVHIIYLMYLIVIGDFRPCLLCSLLLASSVLPSSLLAHPSFTTTTFFISLHPPLASLAAGYLHLASFPGSRAGPSPFLIYFSRANITHECPD